MLQKYSWYSTQTKKEQKLLDIWTVELSCLYPSYSTSVIHALLKVINRYILEAILKQKHNTK